MSDSTAHGSDREPTDRCIESKGPWPFLTRRVYVGLEQQRRTWTSRQHRKTLPSRTAEVMSFTETIWRCIWAPRDLNWWIAILFALGSLLFALGCVFSLFPKLALAYSLTRFGVNAVFFMGSIPFTSAAFLQFYQSANSLKTSPNSPPGMTQRKILLIWAPWDIGWLGSALQFMGTVLFNISTFDAVLPSRSGLEQNVFVWIPDFLGSILFLTSGYLAFAEACHAHGAWKPANVSWRVTTINLFGCVGFMVAAVFAVNLPWPIHLDIGTIALAFTLQGAICFFLGSCLMLDESQVGVET